jgi:hypothetical protein
MTASLWCDSETAVKIIAFRVTSGNKVHRYLIDVAVTENLVFLKSPVNIRITSIYFFNFVAGYTVTSKNLSAGHFRTHTENKGAPSGPYLL